MMVKSAFIAATWSRVECLLARNATAKSKSDPAIRDLGLVHRNIGVPVVEALHRCAQLGSGYDVAD